MNKIKLLQKQVGLSDEQVEGILNEIERETDLWASHDSYKNFTREQIRENVIRTLRTDPQLDNLLTVVLAISEGYEN